MEYAHPESLVSPSWLAKHIGEPGLRVVDFRFDVRPGPDGRFEPTAARDEYETAHIPGAVFVDLMGDLAHPDLPLEILSPERFEKRMGRLGIGNETTVVAYDAGGGTWAARIWWAANLDPGTSTLLPAEGLAELRASAGVPRDKRVITYCGGGVFAAFALFALHLLGHENAALYDASWSEWGADPELPVETGPADVHK